MIPEAYYVHTKPYPMTRFSGICAVPLHEKYTLKFNKTLDCLNLWHQLKFTGLRKKPLYQKKTFVSRQVSSLVSDPLTDSPKNRINGVFLWRVALGLFYLRVWDILYTQRIERDLVRAGDKVAVKVSYVVPQRVWPEQKGWWPLLSNLSFLNTHLEICYETRPVVFPPDISQFSI